MRQCSSDARTMGHPTHSPFESMATGMGGEREGACWHTQSGSSLLPASAKPFVTSERGIKRLRNGTTRQMPFKRFEANVEKSGERSSEKDFTLNQHKLRVERLPFSYSQLRSSLLPILHGTVFHVTNRTGFDGIIRDGLVRHNHEGNFPYSFPQSTRSYAKARSYVSLFDLRTVSDDQIDRALDDFYFLSPFRGKNTIFLFISESLYPALIPWTRARDEDAWKEMFIPHVEAFHPGDIPISHISRVLSANIRQARKRPSSLSKLMNETVPQLYNRRKKSP
jgi:hypothetical protein